MIVDNIIIIGSVVILFGMWLFIGAIKSIKDHKPSIYDKLFIYDLWDIFIGFFIVTLGIIILFIEVDVLNLPE